MTTKRIETSRTQVGQKSLFIETIRDMETGRQIITVYKSYQTPVAFETADVLAVSENVFSSTTGRHIGIIEREYLGTIKSKRLERDEFENLLLETVIDEGLTERDI